MGKTIKQNIKKINKVMALFFFIKNKNIDFELHLTRRKKLANLMPKSHIISSKHLQINVAIQ